MRKPGFELIAGQQDRLHRGTASCLELCDHQVDRLHIIKQMAAYRQNLETRYEGTAKRSEAQSQQLEDTLRV